MPLLHSPGVDVWVLVCQVPHTSHSIPYSEGKLHTNIKTLAKVFITSFLDDQFKMHSYLILGMLKGKNEILKIQYKKGGRKKRVVSSWFRNFVEIQKRILVYIA